MGQQTHIWPFDSFLLFPGVLFLESTKASLFLLKNIFLSRILSERKSIQFRSCLVSIEFLYTIFLWALRHDDIGCIWNRRWQRR
jgi:hypothetical protein